MPVIKRAKTAFTAGELAPELFGRGDVPAWGNGAAKLRNVFIQPTGGLQRRPGLRHLAMLPGAARLVPYEASTELTFLLVLLDGRLRIMRNDVQVAELTGPWTAAMLPQITFTQNASMLLLLHPAMPPQVVQRAETGTWSVAPFVFSAEPFFRFVPASVGLTPGGTTGNVSVTATAPIFAASHVGAMLRMAGKRLRITSFSSPSVVAADVLDALASTDTTTDWVESAFSSAHGWPISACFYQGRLVLGGSRDLPNRLWFSRSANYENFDPGTGLDDQGIGFSLVSDELNAIRAVLAAGTCRSSPRGRSGWCRGIL